MLAWQIKPYIHLMRLDKPVGSLLLLWPTLWAFWVAAKGFPPLNLLSLFTAGVFLMRAAGCVINDIADRHLDKFVERTQGRPLTQGLISLQGALTLLMFLLLGALWIVTQLNAKCFYLAMIGALLTLIYPFCKRYIDAPQLVLGIAFSWGIPMAFAALEQPFSLQLIALLTINFLWTVAYDTVYAMVDKSDDLRIGVRSTAILLGRYDTRVIQLLHAGMQIVWLFLAAMSQYNINFYIFWLIATVFLINQSRLIKAKNPEQCFKAFRQSHWYGALMWLACASVTLDKFV